MPVMNRACFHSERILFACISNTNFLHLCLEKQIRRMVSSFFLYLYLKPLLQISLLDHVPLCSTDLLPFTPILAFLPFSQKKLCAAPMPIKEPTKHNHPSQNPGGGIHLSWFGVLKSNKSSTLTPRPLRRFDIKGGGGGFISFLLGGVIPRIPNLQG